MVEDGGRQLCRAGGAGRRAARGDGGRARRARRDPSLAPTKLYHTSRREERRRRKKARHLFNPIAKATLLILECGHFNYTPVQFNYTPGVVKMITLRKNPGVYAPEYRHSLKSQSYLCSAAQAASTAEKQICNARRACRSSHNNQVPVSVTCLTRLFWPASGVFMSLDL